MINFVQCARYLSSFNLIKLTTQVIENTFTTTVTDSKVDYDFDQLFKWRSLDNGFEEAKRTKKPVFLLIYKTGCPACEKMKEKFSKSVRLMDLSDRFVMIKAEKGKNKALNEKKFEPDGTYVPRILFFTSDGRFIVESYNRHADAEKEHKYFYVQPSQIVESMLFVLKEYGNEPMPVMFEPERSHLDY